MQNLSHNLLLLRLFYHPIQGVFYRRYLGSGDLYNQPTGKINKLGYVEISLFGKSYLGHRLAWFYVKGVWPECMVDHRNQIRHDIRWDNLREATGSMNQQNKLTLPINNTTGYLGVSRRGSKFQATIKVSGVKKHLGYFDTPELAHGAYLTAKAKLHYGFSPESVEENFM